MEINIQSLYAKDVTPNQYAILYYLWNGNMEECRRLLKLIPNWKEETASLKEKGLILKLDKSQVILNKKEVSQMLGYDDNLFWEFFSTYPMHVKSGAGKRILRPQSGDSKAAKVCYKKYNSKVKTRTKHDFVMKCLNKELEDRRKSNSFQYMQGMEVYINQQSWEKYEHLLSEDSTLNTKKHGEDLI